MMPQRDYATGSSPKGMGGCPIMHQQAVPAAREQNVQPLAERGANYAIYLIDPQGHVMSWNSNAQRVKQYKADEVIGRHFGMFYTEEDRQKGEPERALKIARSEGSYEKEGWCVRKDGSRVWVSFIINPIYNERSELAGYAKATRDMTAQRLTEQKIREGTMLKTLVNTAVDGVIMTDAFGTILMFNPACERLFGYMTDEVMGQNVRMLMPTPYRDAHDGYMDNYRRTGERKVIGIGREVSGLRKDGTTFPMDLSIGEAMQEGSLAFVGIVHDLTERKRTEEQLVQAQKMETVGQLSGGIAHDFNNLLTVIIGNADLLSENLKQRPDLKQICDTILNAGERGAELTRRLLAFSRRQTLQPVVLDCNKLVESMRILLRRTLREDIEFRIAANPDLVPAFADPAQLESALLNLALNARDAMPQGGSLTITISNAILDEDYQDMHPEVTPGQYVMIAVTDDGEGMTPEVQQRVFEPFFTTKEVGKGSGLGLSMVYGFIKQSNGHVAVYSEVGMGTTIRLYLPAATAAEQAIGEKRDAREKTPMQGTETVLVAEDDPFVRSHAVASLESLGYNVITAVDGREALAKLDQTDGVDILFSDVVMPGGISGWELAEQAQKQKPELKVLLTSGYPLETLTSRNRCNPAIAILNKPYRKTDLAQRLREVLEARA